VLWGYAWRRSSSLEGDAGGAMLQASGSVMNNHSTTIPPMLLTCKKITVVFPLYKAYRICHMWYFLALSQYTHKAKLVKCIFKLI